MENESSINQNIGRLEGKVELMLVQQQQVLAKQDNLQYALQKQHEDHIGTKRRVEDLENHVRDNVDPVIKDYKAKKLLGIGMVGGASLAGGSLGAGIVKFLAVVVGAGH